ncbi:MurT ligase domain-containing protein [Marinactinospora thermotolerans]|uniref:Lipid II isoglutaminyl synthase (glutamine-hydrolyzing) subunit MurT n=1 Tax=Marinactinospora thermotolerans DSM 45154 TaxID=1122192 RepID=A0A1T4N0Y9_9ACTN|nr:MurT ligase domain-containing protein [Marinactinospora thermotolerans]SJZ72892.1 UDP-N-acetylmuramyl tripeptide synthase [Marinactinospora thermotolerans DSM 45154]
MSELPLRAQLAAALGKGAATLSRATGRGDGSVIGGRVALKVEPDLLAKLARGRRLSLVSATNGKTTTTRLIASALRELGDIATNEHGANMPTGHITALADSPDARNGVLEVDEKYLPQVLRETNAAVVVLMNLSRDQMDRASEINLLAKKWREALAKSETHVIANADDPLVAWAGLGARYATWVSAGQRWKEDSWCCPECGGHLKRDPDPHWECPECGLRRPDTSWAVDNQTDSVIDPNGQRLPLQLNLPGDANRANAVIALATAAAYGIHPKQALPRLREIRSVAGRYTSVVTNGVEVRLLLAKNPAGWLESFAVLSPPHVPVILSINAQVPDGKDTSWLWDVDYTVLRGRRVFCMGERRTDLALRLETDEVPFEIADRVDEVVAKLKAEQPDITKVDVIANYTAFQQIRTAYGRVQ